ncbi:MAG: RidA family protein, partial [Clostridia bacterium]
AEARLAELGIQLPPVPTPMAAYVPTVRAGNLVFVSGQVARRDGKLLYEGRVGTEVTVEQGYECARLCALNALAALRAEVGSLDRVRRIVKVTGWVNCHPDFTQQPQVINGASELLLEVFGDNGRHARAAVGASGLPGGTPVEVELVAEVED